MSKIKVTEKKSLEGYVEMHDSLEPTMIYLNDLEEQSRGCETFTWYTNEDWNDYSQEWSDFMDESGGKLYLTKADYKKDKFVDLNEWYKENAILP